MLAYRQQLVENNDEIAKILEDETLTYQEQAEAIEDVISALKKKTTMSAAQKYLEQIESERLELAKTIAEYQENEMTNAYNQQKIASENLTRAEQKLANAQMQMKNAIDNEVYIQASIAVGEYETEVLAAEVALEKANNEVEQVESTLAQHQTTMSELTENYNWYLDVAAGVVDVETELATKSQNIATANKNASSSFTTLDKIATTSINSISNQFANKNWTSTGRIWASQIASGMNTGLKNLSSDTFKTGISNLENLLKNAFSPKFVINYDITAGIDDTQKYLNVTANKWAIKAYATGGFPEDGLFFANHNELVGKFANGKTAVANNDQITSGIEQASYRGMARALAEHSNNGGSVTVVLQGDADGLFKVVQSKANNYTRQTGEPAFII